MGSGEMHIESLLAAAGVEPDPSTGGVVPPIHLATTFEKSAGGGFHYTREKNPTRAVLEQTLSALEGGIDTAAFSSGMAAATAVVAALGAGSHIVYPLDVYSGARRLFTQIAPRLGIRTTAADFTDLDAVGAAIRPETRLLWMETPSNPLLRITDIRAVVEMASASGVSTLVDNTWASPLLQRPLELGVDLELHSVTKYIAGHSDVLGGAVTTRVECDLFDGVRQYQVVAGAVMDPFSAWLTLRGLRTLSVRMRQACDNADQIAAFLDGHPKVERVHFPGLANFAGREIVVRQMVRSGAMLSFETAGGRDFAEAVPTHTTLFRNATSLGGTESLIEHRVSSEGPESATPGTLIRVSVGIEHAEDLINDLEAALIAAAP